MERCAVHGLILRPDGTCQRCQTSVGARTNRLALIVTGVFVVLGIFAIVLVGMVKRMSEASVRPDIARVAGGSANDPAHPSEGTSPAGASERSPGSQGRATHSKIRIVVYTTSWCPHCKRAKTWLRERDLAFEERDIEADRDARERIKAISGSTGVPVFDIEGQVVRGFDPSRVERIVRDLSAARGG